MVFTPICWLLKDPPRSAVGFKSTHRDGSSFSPSPWPAGISGRAPHTHEQQHECRPRWHGNDKGHSEAPRGHCSMLLVSNIPEDWFCTPAFPWNLRFCLDLGPSFSLGVTLPTILQNPYATVSCHSEYLWATSHLPFQNPCLFCDPDGAVNNHTTPLSQNWQG